MPVNAATSYIYGDVNGDGELKIDDATSTQKYLANMINFTLQQRLAADINGDGYVTISDATEMQKILAQLADTPSKPKSTYITKGSIYFKATGAFEGTNNLFFHIYDTGLSGSAAEIAIPWGSNLGTAAVHLGDGLWRYDLKDLIEYTKHDDFKKGLDTTKKYGVVVWMPYDAPEDAVQTHELMFTTDCIGETICLDGDSITLPFYTPKTVHVARWEKEAETKCYPIASVFDPDIKIDIDGLIDKKYVYTTDIHTPINFLDPEPAEIVF
ncbi:MAG: dockerin type I repeat-containing protein [Oscillospiraceae bacterium]|nr:dockerin type I repeat-containing protein [Oscillospiraceae bacterium]